jgi:serine/threonine protein kinase
MPGPTQTDPQLDAEPDTVDSDGFSDDLKEGTQLLGGQYTILGFLNSGGFGITYLAKDSLERTVVIKECFPNALCRRSTSIVRARSRKHQVDFRSFVSSFVEEARSLARLVHPNIVGVHQVFEDNDTAYMAIDYINGKDLHDVLESTDQAFTPDEIVEMLKKMLSAVEFIHQAGILHRDISPDNILIDTTGNPVLIDFGAASEQGAQATRVLTGRRVVKDGYSPQEFYLTGAEQSPSSDLYALGATFYHVITGKAPPESQRRLALVAEGSPDPYEPLDGRFPGYPPGFLASIDKAVRVLSKDRIATAADWLEVIRKGEGGELDPVAEPASGQDTRPRAQGAVASNMGYIIGAGTVFVVAAAFGLWSMTR